MNPCLITSGFSTSELFLSHLLPKFFHVLGIIFRDWYSTSKCFRVPKLISVIEKTRRYHQIKQAQNKVIDRHDYMKRLDLDVLFKTSLFYSKSDQCCNPSNT